MFASKSVDNNITACAYCEKDMLLTATSTGIVCVWQVSSERCLMHWQADDAEISK